LTFGDSCDLFEKDIIKILWNQLDLYELLIFNRDKYIFLYRKMPPATFDKMMKKIKPIHHNLSEIIDEIEAYKDLIVVRMKNFVDDRTKSIVKIASNNKAKGIKAIKDYTIHVTQTIEDPNVDLTAMNVPRPIRKDTKTDDVFKGGNPYDSIVQEIENMKSKNLDRLYGGKEDIRFDNGNQEDQMFAVGQVAERYDPDNYKKRKLSLDRKRHEIELNQIERKAYAMATRRRNFHQNRSKYFRRNLNKILHRDPRKNLV
jgi:hypothetical protein